MELELSVLDLAVLEEDSALPWRLPAGAFLLLDVAFEAVKELLPYAGLRDEDIAPVRLVSDAPEIAERAQRIQGARDNGLGYAKRMGEATHRMRSRSKVDQEEQSHLPVGKIGLP